MKIGIKVGPRDGIDVLTQSQAKYVEVWFRLDWQNKYHELFSYMRANNIQFGLHFWATIQGKYFPNLVYCRDNIDVDTATAIRETIDIAADSGAFYVNYHPEAQRLGELNLDTSELTVVPGAEVPEEEGFQSLVRHSSHLKDYAKTKNVEVYIETVPKLVPSHFKEGKKHEGRLKPQLIKGISTQRIIEMGKMGFSVCYDFGHVVGQYPNEPRDVIFQKIYNEAKQMVDYTRLVHVNTTIEPLNGTDSHNGILEEDFRQNVFPNKSQFMQIMKVFEANPNLLVIPEPQQEKMIENYGELIKIFGNKNS